MSGGRIRIVVPARNEEIRLEATVRRFCEFFAGAGTVVVVANGCDDDTAGVVRRLLLDYSNLELLETPRAIGKGGAVRWGLKTGSEEFVGFVDADGSASPQELFALYETVRQTGAAGAIGSRWISGASVVRRQPLMRRIASRSFNAIVRVAFGLPYSDTQCGAKVFRRSALQKVMDGLETANFAFDVELLYALRKERESVVEAPIVWRDEPEGTKIWLLGASASMLLAVAQLRLRHSFLNRLSRDTRSPLGVPSLTAESAVASGARPHTEHAHAASGP